MLDAYCDYLDYSHQFIRFTSDPCKMEGIWSGSRIAKGDPISPDYLYLYYDDPETHRTLGERYARLMNFITTDWRHGMGCKATEQSEWQELKRTLTASLAKCKTRLPPPFNFVRRAADDFSADPTEFAEDEDVATNS
jgi:hypothetical protein